MKIKLSIEKLIAKYLLGDITESEKEQLENWIKSSSRHKDLFNDLCSSTSFRKQYETYAKIDSQYAWKCFQKKYCYTSIIRTAIFFKYVAILILPILLATGGWYFYSFAPEIQITTNITSGDAIQPGVHKATLKVVGETEQSLTPAKSMPVKVSQSTIAVVQNGTLIYPPSHIDTNSEKLQKEGSDESNILTTNQGNEFNVTFEDGTTVHLNYDTEIRYPVKFSKTKRMVYLKGEAYFKIAKDARPFYVITDQGTIKQYGTEFNVNTFTPQQTEIALVKGSISITPKDSNQEHFINPGQVAHVDSHKESVNIYSTDLIPYIAWNDGRLIFENRTLESIVDILERWYDVKISFGSAELKQLHFTGNMDRYGTITPILKAIARTTNLQIHIEAREILITN